MAGARRYFLYLLAAVPIAAAVIGVTTALQSGPVPKVAFDMKVKFGNDDVRAGGSVYLSSDGFSYEASRLSFTGTVDGDEVRITGKVLSEDRSKSRDFATTGRLKDNRLSATLNGDRGSRMGTLKLELINR